MTVVAAWFLADILAGIVHWWEDQYLDGKSRFSFINRISKDNDLHHQDPGFMSKLTLWENLDTTVYIAWPLVLFLFLIGTPTIIWLTLLFASFANLVHRFAHMPNVKHNFIISALQGFGIFISHDHHVKHHNGYMARIKKEDTTIRWCPMTNWMNPILDKIKFFKFLEFSLRLVGIRPTKERGA